MKTDIKEYTYPDGALQRVQRVTLDSWQDLEFLKLNYEDPAITCFADIYRLFLVPACPWLFGNMVMFWLPEDVETDFPMETGTFGTVADRVTAAAAALRKGVRIIRGKPVFSDEKVKTFWAELEARDCIRIIKAEHSASHVNSEDDLMALRNRLKERKGIRG